MCRGVDDCRSPMCHVGTSHEVTCRGTINRRCRSLKMRHKVWRWRGDDLHPPPPTMTSSNDEVTKLEAQLQKGKAEKAAWMAVEKVAAEAK